MPGQWIALAIVIIIVLLYIVTTWNTTANEDYLYGFWIAEDDEFCEESGIESMLVFIGEPERSGCMSTERTCYVIIMNDICNQGFTITYRSGWSGPSVGKYQIGASVEFDDADIWPENVTIEVDIRDGTMKIYHCDMVYARLVKQHDTTNVCRAMEKNQI